jgi:hypothetical protein
MFNNYIKGTTMAHEFTGDNWEQEVVQSDKPVLGKGELGLPMANIASRGKI